jgi:uncharacterized oxidoreductase
MTLLFLTRINTLPSGRRLKVIRSIGGRINDNLMVDTITTNLMGPIRMTAALIDQRHRGSSFCKRPRLGSLATCRLALGHATVTPPAGHQERVSGTLDALSDCTARRTSARPPAGAGAVLSA